MSYTRASVAPHALAQATPVAPPVLATVSPQELARQENAAMIKIVVGIIIGIIVIAIAYWLWQQQRKAITPNRRRSTKQSTREMARALYKRLEERGGTSEGTMRSLQQLGRR